MSRKKISFDQVVLDSIVATLVRGGVGGAKKADIVLTSGVKPTQFLMVMTQLMDAGKAVRRGAKKGVVWYSPEFLNGAEVMTTSIPVEVADSISTNAVLSCDVSSAASIINYWHPVDSVTSDTNSDDGIPF